MIKTIFAAALTIAAAFAQPNTGRGRGNRQDMATIARPIDMHDTVWIEDMTQLEVRDSLKAGKTTALVFAGGMEDNGPYVTVSQHNLIVHAMCDSIARKLGRPITLLAPTPPATNADDPRRIRAPLPRSGREQVELQSYPSEQPHG